jgi:hypothetical protein
MRSIPTFIATMVRCPKIVQYLNGARDFSRLVSDPISPHSRGREERKETRVFKLTYPTGRIFGADASSPRYLKQWMQDAGFVDVEEHILKLPVGPWPRNPRLKEVGAFESVNMTEGIQGLTIMLLTRCLNMTAIEVELFLMEVRRDVRNRNIHSYYHLYVGPVRA